jgi:hypothetical protein
MHTFWWSQQQSRKIRERQENKDAAEYYLATVPCGTMYDPETVHLWLFVVVLVFEVEEQAVQRSVYP